MLFRSASPAPQANDIRQGSVYLPAPDARVRRAIDQLLAEEDPGRRGRVSFWLIAALVAVLVLSGVRW